MKLHPSWRLILFTACVIILLTIIFP